VTIIHKVTALYRAVIYRFDCILLSLVYLWKFIKSTEQLIADVLKAKKAFDNIKGV